MEGSVRVLKSFFASFPTKKFTKDEIIVCQGTVLRQTYAVKAGVAKCYDISLDGSQQIISLLTADDIFPMPYVLEDEKTALLFYSAFDNVEVYVIDRSKLVLFLRTHPTILFELCKDMSQKLSDLHFRVNATGKPKAREKILHVLAYLADRFADNTSRRVTVDLALPLTHKDIASLAGLTRETTAAILKQLKDERFVYYDHQHFKIRRKKIEKVLWS